MSVQVVKEKNNLMGALGGLATLAGAVTGQPWLSTLGAGLGTMNSALNGDNSGGNSGNGSLQDILMNFGKTIQGWFKPTDGNIAKVNSKYAGISEAIKNTANQVGSSSTGLMPQNGMFGNANRYFQSLYGGY